MIDERVRSNGGPFSASRSAVLIGACLVAIAGTSWLVLQIPGGREHFLYLEQTYVARIAGYLALAVILLWALPRLSQRTLAEFGLRNPTFVGVALAICVGIALVAVAFVNAALLQGPAGAKSGGIASDLFENMNAALVVPTYGVLTIAAAPLAEELFFRGFVYNALRVRTSAAVAVGVSAALFALAHLSVREALPLLAGGIAYGVLYARTRNLVVPIVAHATYNALVYASLFLAPH